MNEYRTLVLAMWLAMVDGRPVAKVIKATAKRLRDKTKSQGFYDAMTSLINGSDTDVISAVEWADKQLIKWGTQ
ncbi:MAG: hypothetical protein ACRCSS_20945 [Shewanella sp.]